MYIQEIENCDKTIIEYGALTLFFNDTATTKIYTLSLHDALPIFINVPARGIGERTVEILRQHAREQDVSMWQADRKSTRLNSSHVRISYAVFCLKKKNILKNRQE